MKMIRFAIEVVAAVVAVMLAEGVVTFAAEAGSEAAVPRLSGAVVIRESDICRGHPRILLTKESIPKIRRRLSQDFEGVAPQRYLAMKTEIEKQWNDPFQPAEFRQPERLARHALIYALGAIDGVKYSGQTDGIRHRSIEEIGRKGVDFLKMSVSHWDRNSAEAGYSTFHLLPVCWAYDWLHPLLSDRERRDLVGRLISAAYNQKRKSQTTTFKDYALAGHNYVVVALTIAHENLEIDHTAPWDANVRYQGNSDEYAGQLLDDLNNIYLARFFDGWSFANQGGGNFQGTMGHYSNVFMFMQVLWPIETATSRDLLSNFEYLTTSPEWLTYAQMPEYDFVDERGRQQNMKGSTFATDDENPFPRVWAPRQVMMVARRFPDRDNGALAAWFIRNYVPEHRWMKSAQDLILHDETVPSKSPTELDLPLTRYFGCLEGNLPPGTPAGIKHPVGAGIVVMRSSWTDPAATLAVFKCRSFRFTHNHRDSNSFTIIKKGNLAIDSGRYQKGDWAPQEANYSYRTIAHNTVIIFDPEERFDEALKRANDGGHRLTGASRNWPDDFVVGGRRDVGGMVRFESVPGKYDYMLGDATRAFQSVQFTDLGNRPKVGLAQRAFVYLRSTGGDRDLFVVFDRVTSTNREFEKRWLLHTVELPTIDGKYTRGGVDGKGGMNGFKGTPGSVSLDSSLVTVKENQGTLFCRTLLPVRHRTVLRGGPNDKGEHAEADSYEYLDATNKQWTLGPKKYMVNKYLRQCGNYRIEIIPQEKRTDDVFLHVLHSAGQLQMPQANLVSSQDRNVCGVCVNGWCVVFARSGRIEKASWTLSQPVKHVLITDLEPDREYQVSLDHDIVTITRQTGGKRASEQGTLLIEGLVAIKQGQ